MGSVALLAKIPMQRILDARVSFPWDYKYLARECTTVINMHEVRLKSSEIQVSIMLEYVHALTVGGGL